VTFVSFVLIPKMKKAFDGAKAANQFAGAAVISSSLLSSLWPSFSLAWLMFLLWNVAPLSLGVP